MHLAHEPDPRSPWCLIPLQPSVGGKCLCLPAMLSFNCAADLILVTYLLTENTVFRTPSPQEYSLDSDRRLWRHTNATLCVWFCGFPCLCQCTCVGTKWVGWVTHHNFQKSAFGGTECACWCGGGLIQQQTACWTMCHTPERLSKGEKGKQQNAAHLLNLLLAEFVLLLLIIQEGGQLLLLLGHDLLLELLLIRHRRLHLVDTWNEKEKRARAVSSGNNNLKH